MGSNQLRCSHYSCSFLSQNLFLACFSAHTKTKIYIKSNKYGKKQVTNWPKKNSIDNTTRFRDLLFHKSYFDKTCLRAPWRDHTLLIFWLVQWSFCVLSVSRGVSTIVCPNICFDVCGVFFFRSLLSFTHFHIVIRLDLHELCGETVAYQWHTKKRNQQQHTKINKYTQNN